MDLIDARDIVVHIECNLVCMHWSAVATVRWNKPSSKPCEYVLMHGAHNCVCRGIFLSYYGSFVVVFNRIHRMHFSLMFRLAFVFRYLFLFFACFLSAHNRKRKQPWSNGHTCRPQTMQPLTNSAKRFWCYQKMKLNAKKNNKQQLTNAEVKLQEKFRVMWLGCTAIAIINGHLCWVRKR